MAAYEIKQMFTDLQSYWSSRKSAIIKYWDFYYGFRQRFYMPAFEGETSEEYQNRQSGAVIENHCAKTCDVIVSYLYGQPSSDSRVTVRVLDKDGKILTKAQQFLRDRVWQTNKIDTFRIGMALMASVTGYAVVHKEFVDMRTMLPFDESGKLPSELKSAKLKFGAVRYDIYDSVDTMPLPLLVDSGKDDYEIYPHILGAIMRYYSRDNYSGMSYIDRLFGRSFRSEEVVELFTASEFIRAAVTDMGLRVDEPLKRIANKYNRIDIPFTVFRNYGDPMYLVGDSDLAQMVELQGGLNELVNDDKATIAYHSFPILKFKNGATMPQNFIRKVNSVFEFERDQDAEYLVWDNVLEASQKRQEAIRTNMTVVSGVSQLSRGNATSVGQVRSGAALKTLFQADINAIALKVPFFKAAEEHLARTTLEMYEAETGESFGEYAIQVEFPDDFVGLDKLLKAQTEQIEVNEGVESVRELIKERHLDATSEAEIDQILQQVLDEKQKLAKASAAPPRTVPGTSPDKKSQEQAV